IREGEYYYGVLVVADKEGYATNGFKWDEKLKEDGELIWYYPSTLFIRGSQFDPEYDDEKLSYNEISWVYEYRSSLFSSSPGIDLIIEAASVDYQVLASMDIDSLKMLVLGVVRSYATLNKTSKNYASISGLIFEFTYRALVVLDNENQNKLVDYLTEYGAVKQLNYISQITLGTVNPLTAFLVGQMLSQNYGDSDILSISDLYDSEGNLIQEYSEEMYEEDDSVEYVVGASINSTTGNKKYWVIESQFSKNGDDTISISQAYQKGQEYFSPNYSVGKSRKLKPTTFVPAKIILLDENDKEVVQRVQMTVLQLSMFGQALSEMMMEQKFNEDVGEIFEVVMILVDVILLIAVPAAGIAKIIATYGLRQAVKYGAKKAMVGLARHVFAKGGKKLLIELALGIGMTTIEIYRSELEKTEWGKKFLSYYNIILVAMILRDLGRLVRSTALIQKALINGRKALANFTPKLQKGFQETLLNLEAFKNASVKWAKNPQAYAQTNMGKVKVGTPDEQFQLLFAAERSKLKNQLRIKHGSNVNVGSSLDNVVKNNKKLPMGVPSLKKAKFDWEHIFERHSDWGKIAKQSGKKDIFQGLSAPQIKEVVKGAYQNIYKHTKSTSQTSITIMRSKYKNWDIEFIVNRSTKIIETAYPLNRKL
ncbi:MAG: hypothetical protein JKY54_07755, partial [Flavobacteriales bacterium]|nr:hypothetical protein [Flavobacteriales bacterium]